MSQIGNTIDTSEAAERAGVSSQRILQCIRDGLFKAEKFGKRNWAIDLTTFEVWRKTGRHWSTARRKQHGI